MKKTNFLNDFHDFYSAQYPQRWESLFKQLQLKENQVARKNMFCQNHSVFEKGENIPRDESGLLQYYIMDPASIYVAEALQVQSGHKVLDMCAAPGGKSLILIEKLQQAGELIANEISSSRRERLKKVIQQYIPMSVRPRVWVMGKDGATYSLTHAEQFDRILVDAPCSGERHLLENQKAQIEWSSKVSPRLAQRQYALLAGAFRALKPDGKVVYSTCSISKMENDGVIEKLFKKGKIKFEVEKIDELETNSESEKTEFGYQFLPDRCGFGPIYVSRMRKWD